MANNTFSTVGNNNWTAPADVVAAKIEIWAGGGGGGGGNAARAAGGGGGGAFAQGNSYATTPGHIYSLTVGNGGANGAAGANGVAGANSVFRHNNGANAYWSEGGRPGLRSADGGVGGAGGTVANSSGDLRFAGGVGGTRPGTGVSAAGGGGADNNQTGGNASGATPGNSIIGGDGGTATAGNDGGAGNVPGGGGGGGDNNNKAGGPGGAGQIIITFVYSRSISGAGGAVLGGAATILSNRGYSVTSSGGAVFGGVGTIATGKNCTSLGGVVLGGSAGLIAGRTVTGAGGAVFGGSAAYQPNSLYTVEGDGGAVVGGAADIAFEYGDALQSHVWENVTATKYWYREVGGSTNPFDWITGSDPSIWYNIYIAWIELWARDPQKVRITFANLDQCEFDISADLFDIDNIIFQGDEADEYDGYTPPAFDDFNVIKIEFYLEEAVEVVYSGLTFRQPSFIKEEDDELIFLIANFMRAVNA